MNGIIIKRKMSYDNNDIQGYDDIGADGLTNLPEEALSLIPGIMVLFSVLIIFFRYKVFCLKFLVFFEI